MESLETVRGARASWPKASAGVSPSGTHQAARLDETPIGNPNGKVLVLPLFAVVGTAIGVGVGAWQDHIVIGALLGNLVATVIGVGLLAYRGRNL